MVKQSVVHHRPLSGQGTMPEAFSYHSFLVLKCHKEMAAGAWTDLYIAVIGITEFLQKILFVGIWNLECRNYKVKGTKYDKFIYLKVGTYYEDWSVEFLRKLEDLEKTNIVSNSAVFLWKQYHFVVLETHLVWGKCEHYWDSYFYHKLLLVHIPGIRDLELTDLNTKTIIQLTDYKSIIRW